jgi:hypothetical protein
VVIAAVAVAVWRDGDRKTTPPARAIDEQAGAAAARRACGHLDRLLGVVRDDGPAPDALDAADDLVRQSGVAVSLDPAWAQLSSAAQALRVGIRQDDPQATALALPIARDACTAVEDP